MFEKAAEQHLQVLAILLIALSCELEDLCSGVCEKRTS